jgi:uncharacterized protein YrzB (UPF0473 family)
MLENKMYVIDDEGNEIEMEILFTFSNEEAGKNYVLFLNPQADSEEVFAASYDEEGTLTEVTDEDEWAMVEEVFGAFVDEQEQD